MKIPNSFTKGYLEFGTNGTKCCILGQSPYGMQTKLLSQRSTHEVAWRRQTLVFPGRTVSRRECPSAGAALLHKTMQPPGPSCCVGCVTRHSCGLWLRVVHPSAQACLWEGEIRVRAASTGQVQPGNCLPTSTHIPSSHMESEGHSSCQRPGNGVTIYKTVRWEVSLNEEEEEKS